MKFLENSMKMYFTYNNLDHNVFLYIIISELNYFVTKSKVKWKLYAQNFTIRLYKHKLEIAL